MKKSHVKEQVLHNRAIPTWDMGVLGFAVVVLGALVVWRLWAVWQGYPFSWIDEIYYSGPGVSWVRDQIPANPGLAEQFALRGAPGMEEICHLLFWIGWWVRLPFMLLFPADRFEGRLLGETFIFISATLVFWRAAAHYCRPAVASVLTLFFVSSPMVFAEWPGRNDLLSVVFGVFAWQCLMRNLDRGKPWFHGIISGLALAAAFFSHPFGGFFWAAFSGLSVLFQKRFSLLLGTCLGGVMGVALWSLTVLQDFEIWREHYRAMVAFKFTLPRNPEIGWASLLAGTLNSNFTWWFWVPLLAFFGWMSDRRPILIASAIVLIAFAFWRCYFFEYFIGSYAVHFRTLLLLIATFSWPPFQSWYSEKVSWRFRWIPLGLAVAISLLMGVRPCRSVLAEPFLADTRQHLNSLQTEIRKTIPDDARVLVDCRLYFLAGKPISTAMMLHEELSLENFDYVIFSRDPAPVRDSMYQWADALTNAQKQEFLGTFRRVATIQAPQVKYPKWLNIRNPRYEIPGCFIYQRMDPDRSNPEEMP